MTDIYVFGDSHAWNGWVEWPTWQIDPNRVIIYHMGPVLAYTVGSKGIDRMNLKDHSTIRSGDVAIFSFGEIDCRTHISRHIQLPDRTYQIIIDDIVAKYFECIKLNADRYDSANPLKIWVYSVPPPAYRDLITEQDKFPVSASDDERKEYVKYFNLKLREFCHRYAYGFFDVHNAYADQNEMLNRDLSDGTVHIRDGRFIIDFIRSNQIINK
jgi:hypothetical protein